MEGKITKCRKDLRSLKMTLNSLKERNEKLKKALILKQKGEVDIAKVEQLEKKVEKETETKKPNLKVLKNNKDSKDNKAEKLKDNKNEEQKSKNRPKNIDIKWPTELKYLQKEEEEEEEEESEEAIRALRKD